MKKIVDHHAERGRLPDGWWPVCFACEVGAETWFEFEKAHLIDRCLDGLDGPQNVIPLCHRCHRTMPSFGPGEEEEAWAWIRDHPHWLEPLINHPAPIPAMKVGGGAQRPWSPV
jgi:hypothetical protein